MVVVVVVRAGGGGGGGNPKYSNKGSETRSSRTVFSEQSFEHKGENGCCCWRNEKVMQNRHHFYRVRNVGVFHSSLSLLNWFVKSFMFYIKLLDIRHNNASKQRSSRSVGISVNHSGEYKLRTKKIIQLVV